MDRGVGWGVVQEAAYPLWALLAAGCAAVSATMLIEAKREGLSSQAWLAAICFGLWLGLAAAYFFFWGAG